MCHIYVRCRSFNVYGDNKDINVVFITFSGFYLDCVKNDLHFFRYLFSSKECKSNINIIKPLSFDLIRSFVFLIN